MVQLSHPYMTTGKNIALTLQTFVGKVMSLLFNTLSRSVIALVWSESSSVVSDSVIPWIIQSMEFSRPEYWSGLPFPSPGDLPNLGIEPTSQIRWGDSLPLSHQGSPSDTELHSVKFGEMFKEMSGWIDEWMNRWVVRRVSHWHGELTWAELVEGWPTYFFKSPTTFPLMLSWE